MQKPLNTLFILLLFTIVVHSQQNAQVQTDFVEPEVVRSESQIPTQSIEPIQTNAQSPNSQNAQKIPQNVNLNQEVPIREPNSPSSNAEQQIQQQQIRLAKEQAQKARRMAQEARIQAERDRAARQAREDDQLRKVKSDSSISQTEKKKQEERLNFRKESRKVEPGTKFTEYLFEQPSGVSEFFVNLPVSQQVAMNFYTYVAEDNTYVRTKNIEEEQPVQVYVYENNERILYHGEFYFQLYLTFQGQAEAMYLIRVINPGLTKLISMNTKKLIENTHLGDTLIKEQAGSHVERTQNLAVEVTKWFQAFRKNSLLDFQDIKRTSQHIRKYYSYELLESVLCVILCVFQLKMIGKLLKGSSIV